MTQVAATREKLRYCPLLIRKHKPFGTSKQHTLRRLLNAVTFYEKVFYFGLFDAQLFSSAICCYKKSFVNMQPISNNAASVTHYP
jgi:hypothetical protein